MTINAFADHPRPIASIDKISIADRINPHKARYLPSIAGRVLLLTETL